MKRVGSAKKQKVDSVKKERSAAPFVHVLVFVCRFYSMNYSEHFGMERDSSEQRPAWCHKPAHNAVPTFSPPFRLPHSYKPPSHRLVY